MIIQEKSRKDFIKEKATLDEKIVTLTAEIDEKDALIAGLQAVNGDYSAEIKTLQQEKAFLSQLLNSFKRQRRYVVGARKEAQTELQDLTKFNDDLWEDYVKYVYAYESAIRSARVHKKTVKEQKGAISKMVADVQELVKINGELQYVRERIIKEAGAWKRRFEDVSEEKFVLEDRIATLTAKVEENMASISALKAEKKDNRGAIETLEVDNAFLSKFVKSLKEQRKALVSQRNTSKAEAEQLKKYNDDLWKDYVKYVKAFEGAVRSARKHKATIKDQQGAIDKLSNDVAELILNNEELERTREHIIKQAGSWKKRFEEARDEAETYRREAVSGRAKIEGLKNVANQEVYSHLYYIIIDEFKKQYPSIPALSLEDKLNDKYGDRGVALYKAVAQAKKIDKKIASGKKRLKEEAGYKAITENISKRFDFFMENQTKEVREAFKDVCTKVICDDFTTSEVIDDVVEREKVIPFMKRKETVLVLGLVAAAIVAIGAGTVTANQRNQNTISNLRNENTSQGIVIEEQESEISELVTENSSLREENSEVKEENSSLREEVTELEEENSSLREEITEVVEENSSLREEVTELEEENSEIKEENEDLKDQLGNYADDVVKLQMTETDKAMYQDLIMKRGETLDSVPVFTYDKSTGEVDIVCNYLNSRDQEKVKHISFDMPIANPNGIYTATDVLEALEDAGTNVKVDEYSLSETVGNTSVLYGITTRENVKLGKLEVEVDALVIEEGKVVSSTNERATYDISIDKVTAAEELISKLEQHTDIYLQLAQEKLDNKADVETGTDSELQ